MSSISSYKGITPFSNEGTMAKIVADKNNTYIPIADVDDNGDYTLTFYVKADTTRYFNVLQINTPEDFEDGESVLQTIECTTQWQKVSFTFAMALKNSGVYFSLNKGTYYIYHAKLEKGNKATDYSKAESDDTEYLEQKIIEMSSEFNISLSEISSRVTQTETRISGAESSITTAQSEIKQNADNINLKVSKDDIISEINQSAEEVKIQANKINLNGAVTISSLDDSLKENIENVANWCDENDKTLINGGKIATGTVTSKEINVEELFAQNIEATGKITGAEYNTGNGTFAVDTSGKLTSKNIEILGGKLEITANAATQDIISIVFTNTSGVKFETKVTAVGITTYKDGVQTAALNGLFGTVSANSIQKGGKNVIFSNDNGIASFQNANTYMEVTTTGGSSKGVTWWSSDSRLKENIEDTDINNALEIVDQIKHHKFDWKDENIKSVKLGYLAHELQELDEDMVFDVKQPEGSEYDDLLQIDETKVIPYLSKAIQELHTIVKNQQNEIETLKEIVNANNQKND